MTQPALAAASERDVEVVAQPARQRHVPATPEVLEGHRGIGRVEVLRKLEAEQQRDADRDVRVAAEVGKDLDRVAVHRDEHLERRMAVRGGEHLVDDVRCEVIRDHDLQEETAEDQEERARVLDPPRIARRLELRQELTRANDRAGDEMREERLEDREAHERRRHELAPVGVDHVRDRHEREERDPDRQRDMRDPRSPDCVVDRREEEVRVLEVAEQAEVERDGEREEPLPHAPASRERWIASARTWLTIVEAASRKTKCQSHQA